MQSLKIAQCTPQKPRNLPPIFCVFVLLLRQQGIVGSFEEVLP